MWSGTAALYLSSSLYALLDRAKETQPTPAFALSLRVSLDIGGPSVPGFSGSWETENPGTEDPAEIFMIHIQRANETSTNLSNCEVPWNSCCPHWTFVTVWDRRATG
jgi:hypothetical protein